jgi:hypothetical protein
VIITVLLPVIVYARVLAGIAAQLLAQELVNLPAGLAIAVIAVVQGVRETVHLHAALHVTIIAVL